MDKSIPQTFKDLQGQKEYLKVAPSNSLRLPHDSEFFGLFMNLVPRQTVLQMINEQMHEKDVALIRNNFPYTAMLQDLPNVHHYCLWSKKDKLTNKQISEFVKLQFPNNKWFAVERNFNKKSVPEVWHTHVFIEE